MTVAYIAISAHSPTSFRLSLPGVAHCVLDQGSLETLICEEGWGCNMKRAIRIFAKVLLELMRNVQLRAMGERVQSMRARTWTGQ